MGADRRGIVGLRIVALGYLALLLVIPVGVVFYRTFDHGVSAVIDSVTTPAAVSAFWLTIEVAVIAVPLNIVFGIATALVLVRGRFPGKRLLDTLIDLPFAVSPVVIGLALLAGLRPQRLVRLVPGRQRHPDHLLGPGHGAGHGLRLAAVRGPRGRSRCCARSATEQEQAAADAGGVAVADASARVTLPAIRWGVAYGVVLTDRPRDR